MYNYLKLFFCYWLCLSLWLIQDSNRKGRVLWKLSGDLATIFQNWISWNEQKMREAHITRRGTSFYLLIFIEKIINRKIEHSLLVIPLGLQGKNRRKRLYFHRALEMKQPQTITEPILIKISNYYCGAAFCGPARVCGCFISTVC